MTEPWPFDLYETASFPAEWRGFAREDQVAPLSGDWKVWILLGGRGSGKTRSGAEWVLEQVRAGAQRIALVAPTLHDGREVMLGGDSGLLNIAPKSARPRYEPTRRRLLFPNGAKAYLFSAYEADRLRGPQFDCAWGDEFCAWPDADAILANLRLGLRLGKHPQLCLTSTPRPLPVLDRLIAEAGTRLSQSRTSDNEDNLAPGFITSMEGLYGGTALGRQELDGMIVRDHPGAIFSRADIDGSRVASAPVLERILIALDPPATSGPKADACGLIVAGRSGHGDDARAYILSDETLSQMRPEVWAERAVALFHHFGADAILAETNQGGEMVESLIQQLDSNVPVLKRFARQAKSTRAMPVGLLYARGRVCHVGRLDALEDELCSFGGPYQKGSPDRMDALVWAVTELLLNRTEPRLRFF